MTTVWRLFIVFALLTAARIAGLHLSVVDLYYDEAQYWAWAQAPAFGYFSKPPLLAWIINAGGHVCGASEACVRAPSPIFYFGTAMATYFAARTLYGARVAAWSAVCLMLAPGIIFSTRIISTDVPLLFAWALAVLGFVKLRERPTWGWTVLMGLSFGFGLLAKYAMIYFVLGIALAALSDAPTRALLRRPHIWVAMLLGFAILMPNLIWVAAHDFVTFRHTEDNISGGGLHLNPMGLLEFAASQFGVFGPVMLAVFLLLLARPRLRQELSGADRVMIAFALPPLVLVALVGLLSKANANWAAPSIITLIIVAVAALLREQSRGWLYATAVLGVAVQGTLWVGDVFAERLSIPGLADGDIYHRTLGWSELGGQVAARARQTGARSIVSEHRDVVASLIYDLRNGGWPVLSWPTSKTPGHQFDIDRPLTGNAAEPLLVVSSCPSPARFAAHYAEVATLDPIVTPTGPHSERRFFAYKLSGAKDGPKTLGPCIPG